MGAYMAMNAETQKTEIIVWRDVAPNKLPVFKITLQAGDKKCYVSMSQEQADFVCDKLDEKLAELEKITLKKGGK